MEKTTNQPAKEEVIREFTPLGKYRRFMRRGIRIGDRAQMDLLRDTLMQILEAGGFAKPAPGILPLQ